MRNKISKGNSLDYEKLCVLHMEFQLYPVCDGKLLKNSALRMTMPRFITEDDGLVKQCEVC